MARPLPSSRVYQGEDGPAVLGRFHAPCGEALAFANPLHVASERLAHVARLQEFIRVQDKAAWSSRSVNWVDSMARAMNYLPNT